MPGASAADWNENTFVTVGEVIGSVGNSGNAAGKPSHLHYTILAVFPYVWRLDGETQGWKKMFYLNPDARLRSIESPG